MLCYLNPTLVILIYISCMGSAEIHNILIQWIGTILRFTELTQTIPMDFFFFFFISWYNVCIDRDLNIPIGLFHDDKKLIKNCLVIMIIGSEAIDSTTTNGLVISPNQWLWSVNLLSLLFPLCDQWGLFMDETGEIWVTCCTWIPRTNNKELYLNLDSNWVQVALSMHDKPIRIKNLDQPKLRPSYLFTTVVYLYIFNPN